MYYKAPPVISDCWKAYGGLQSIDFNHFTVNHIMNFVEPDSGAHTQHIERLWRYLRNSIPRQIWGQEALI